ncbi:M23 family metallopeptidase [Streptomyces sp. NPDC051546]|uniref:M23 family metallopeptidase n=1 Tax=Streptomyces sp. NPDC051546 TaxID=3365655 RepID=UPI0037AB545A
MSTPTTGGGIRSVVAATVVLTSWGEPDGNRIVLQHEDGTRTHYQHLTQLLVHPGQQLAPGHTLARYGDHTPAAPGPPPTP